MKKSVFGLANNKEHADRIVNRLQQSGFSNSDISILFSDKEGRYGSFDGNKTKQGTLETQKSSKAPEGAASGATIGGIIGGSLGLLAGIGSLAIPGLGAFVAAGPIMGALSGSAIGGALGLLAGALVGMGIPEYEAKKYESSLKAGNVLICVHTNDIKQIDQAKEILQKEGAKDISSSRETAGSR